MKPLIVLVTAFSRLILRCFGIKTNKKAKSYTEEEIKTFFDISSESGLIEEAENVTKYMKPGIWAYFSDNKTVFKIRRKKDKKIFYIGRYDWRYSVGTSVHQYEGTQFDFETMRRIGDYNDTYISNYSESE